MSRTTVKTKCIGCEDFRCTYCIVRAKKVQLSSGTCSWCKKTKDLRDFIELERKRGVAARCMSCIVADREPDCKESTPRQTKPVAKTGVIEPTLTRSEWDDGLKAQKLWDAKKWTPTIASQTVPTTARQTAEQKEMAQAWATGQFKAQYAATKKLETVSTVLEAKAEPEKSRGWKQTEQYPTLDEIDDKARFGEGFKASMTTGAAPLDDDQVLRVIDNTPNDDYDDYDSEDRYPY